MGKISLVKQKLAVVLAYFLIYVVWGSTYYFIGIALRDILTFLLGALRFSAAGILLLAWRKGTASAAYPAFSGERHCPAVRRHGRHHVGIALCE